MKFIADYKVTDGWEMRQFQASRISGDNCHKFDERRGWATVSAGNVCLVDEVTSNIMDGKTAKGGIQMDPVRLSYAISMTDLQDNLQTSATALPLKQPTAEQQSQIAASGAPVMPLGQKPQVSDERVTQGTDVSSDFSKSGKQGQNQQPTQTSQTGPGQYIDVQG